MVLQWSSMKLYIEPWVTWSMSSTYRFVMVDICFTFKPWGFLERRTSNNRIGWAVFNPPLAININILLQLQATLRYQRWTSIITTRPLLHAYIPNNSRLNSRNCYLWMREIHMVKTMRIILCIRRTINESLNPKTSSPLTCGAQ